ncbi:MAG: fumarylacetoacetate hydrolase family protein, partial [Pseudomonadota bacterium]
MKLLRYGPVGEEKPGNLDADGVIRDLSSAVGDIAGDVLTPEGLERLASLDLNVLPVVDPEQRIGPCVGHVGKFICIGLNYADHAAESGKEVPPEPVIFMKATSAICGPNDQV